MPVPDLLGFWGVTAFEGRLVCLTSRTVSGVGVRVFGRSDSAIRGRRLHRLPPPCGEGLRVGGSQVGGSFRQKAPVQGVVLNGVHARHPPTLALLRPCGSSAATLPARGRETMNTSASALCLPPPCGEGLRVGAPNPDYAFSAFRRAASGRRRGAGRRRSWSRLRHPARRSGPGVPQRRGARRDCR